MCTTMAIITEYKEYSGDENMSIDQKNLEFAISQKLREPILRFYGWKPKCVSVGRNQSFEDINRDFCKKNNIDIVKRITGGRGLLHDNELTYSFVCPADFLNNGESVIKSYKEISSAIILGFKELNIELTLGGNKKIKTSYDYCMSLSTGADLNYRNKKLIGSAQYRSQNYILQHGSILFDYDKDLIETIFSEKINSEEITCMKEINSDITREETAEAVKAGFEKYFRIAFRR